jgi:hypothetical protein
MSFWKKLGKIASIAAPIAAAPFTGGATLALIGAGAGAAGGALSGGGVKGALLGAGLGGATAGFLGGSGGAVGGNVAKTGAGSILKSAITNPNVLATIGSTLAAGTDQAAKNRQAQTQDQLYRDQIALSAQQQNENAQINRAQLEMQQKAADAKARQDAADAAIRSDKIKNWTPANRPAGIPTISFVHGPGAGAMQAADEMERQALLRQLNGESFTPLAPLASTFQPSAMAKAGTLEKIGNILGPSLSIAAMIKKAQDDAVSDRG